MEDFVMLTANAGVLISYHGKKILIDALHDRYTTLFSSVPSELLTHIADGDGEFAEVDLMLYTHDHPDHYSERWTRRFLKNHPNTEFVSPIADFADRDHVHVLDAEEENLLLAGVFLHCCRLMHDGQEYAGIPNYGFVLEIDGFRIAVLGDATFDKAAIRGMLGNRPVDLALLNFPYVTLHRGREIVTDVIRPQRMIVFHLPYEEKDNSDFIRSTRNALRRNTMLPRAEMLLEERQKIEIG